LSATRGVELHYFGAALLARVRDRQRHPRLASHVGYGPTKEFFDKTWALPDIEQM
jgi:hypothetical protein